jgi:alkanesulfonate monooxygenase SsuD/methylene tetrahydromethanopterin reductase-like flavin-dependent oxidoreductase (luciferase family)
MAGRGSFIESFPLFGYNLEDYNALFDEKLRLLMKLREKERITWQGTYRSSLNDLGVYPRPVQKEIPIWIAVGGTPESVVRAASLKLPLAVAIIGGMPENFVPFVDLYKKASREAGNTNPLQLSINTPAYIADESQQASDEFWPHYETIFSQIGKERGWPPTTRQQFEATRSPKGALMVGSPQQIIDKIMLEYELFGHTRFLAQMGVGTIPHNKLMHSIELYGTKVAPVIRKEIQD